MRESLHSTRHLKRIENILEGCGYPRLRFNNQSNLISAMLWPGETPLAGCIGQQYSPPPDHDFPMLILATDVRIVTFVSNTDVDNYLPTLASGHPTTSLIRFTIMNAAVLMGNSGFGTRTTGE